MSIMMDLGDGCNYLTASGFDVSLFLGLRFAKELRAGGPTELCFWAS